MRHGNRYELLVPEATQGQSKLCRDQNQKIATMEMADLENAAQSATAADTLLSATEQGSPGPSQGGALWRPFRQSLLRKARHLTTSFRRNLRPSRRGDETDEADLDNLAAAAAVEEPSVVDAAEALIQDGSRTRSDVTAVNGSRSHLAHAGFTNQPFQPVIDENAALVAQNLPQGDGSQILDTESGAMDLSLPRHKRIVIKMTDEEIATENKGRQEIRGIWRNGDIGDTSYIEDSWKSLWEENSEAEKGLFQWPCSDADRKSLQLDLVDALHSASVDEVWPGRGLRILSCWISLIGLRLNDLYLKHNYAEPGSEKRTDHPVILTRILLECIWTCNKSRPATVGDVLESCYRRHILLQPHNPHTSFETRYSNSILQDHIRAVRISIYLVSIVYKHEFPTANQMEDFESVWSTAISDTEIKMRPERPHVEVKSGKDPFVAVGDINLKDLQSIGQLRILWTPYWDEHFELQTLWTTNVLKLYWFSPRLSKYLISM